MEIGRNAVVAQDGNFIGNKAIETAQKDRREFALEIKMHHVVRSMYPGVRPATTNNFYLFAKYGTQGGIHRFLHA